MHAKTGSTLTAQEWSADDARLAELAQVRAQLEHLQRQLDEHERLNTMLRDAAEQFVGAMAHDLKNPLAAIKVNVQGLKRWLDKGADLTPEQWTERLGRIETSVEQVLDRIAAARSRVNASSAAPRTLRREAVDAVVLTRQVVDTFRQAAGQQRIRLDCRCPVLVGLWDGERLRQTMERLLDNALKFSPGGEEVAVGLQRQETGSHGCAVLQVRDGGIGIPSRDLPHIFERFYRAENVVGRFPGAGLGLFEAQLDVHQHAGDIAAESSEGSGAVFTVRLPVAPDQPRLQ